MITTHLNVTRLLRLTAALASAIGLLGCSLTPRGEAASPPAWEAENPIQPRRQPPLGLEDFLQSSHEPAAPARARLGRWLFYDTRLSADKTVSCATCHRPEHAFSEPTAVSVGIDGQRGTRKAPTFINQATTLQPNFFWDGRAQSLEDQALGPIANPIEMGNSHASMVTTLSQVPGYKPYFKEAFGTEAITKERVAEAIAAYERTRVSGNSPYDRWRYNRDESAVPAPAKRGYELFFDKARCSQCHVGSNFTDSMFHNLGVGWDQRAKTFSDEGRFVVTRKAADRGAFKTPTLREVTKRAPYMHDGSIATLREVIELYNHGGVPNPALSPKISPLRLTDEEIDALVAFLATLEGEGYQDVAPKSFPE